MNDSKPIHSKKTVSLADFDLICQIEQG